MYLYYLPTRENTRSEVVVRLLVDMGSLLMTFIDRCLNDNIKSLTSASPALLLLFRVNGILLC